MWFLPGCYDCCVYFLCAESGETRWIFKTGEAVKSSPTVDPVTGLVIVGSHDGTVYALNPEVRTSSIPKSSVCQHDERNVCSHSSKHLQKV